jgi:hypothetical protein
MSNAMRTATLHHLRVHCKQKSDDTGETIEFFYKKVTKKGGQVNKNRHFVDKPTVHVDAQAYLCGCLQYRCGGKKRRGLAGKGGFVES